MTYASRFSVRFSFLVQTFFGLCLCLSQGPAQAQEVRVGTPVALAAALAEARGGTIILEAGDYGVLELARAFPEQITLRSEALHEARFEVIRLTGASGVVLQGLRVIDGLAVTKGASDVTVRDSRITGNVYLRNAARFVFADNEVTGGRYGIVLNFVAGFRITNNLVQNVTEDLMRITGPSSDGWIEGNILADVRAKPGTHPDIIQFMHHQGVTPRNITIRRNLMHDPVVRGNVSAQGVFVSDPGRGAQNRGYSDIVIEENLINVAAPNSVFVNSSRSSVTIRNNTLISYQGGGGNIRLIGKSFGDGGPQIEGNVFKELIDKDRLVRLGPNLVYKGTPETRLFSGPGSRWQDYLPILGSTLDRSGMGAVGFLADLQASQKPGYDGPPLLGPSWAQ